MMRSDWELPLSSVSNFEVAQLLSSDAKALEEEEEIVLAVKEVACSLPHKFW